MKPRVTGSSGVESRERSSQESRVTSTPILSSLVSLYSPSVSSVHSTVNSHPLEESNFLDEDSAQNISTVSTENSTSVDASSSLLEECIYFWLIVDLLTLLNCSYHSKPGFK